MPNQAVWFIPTISKVILKENTRISCGWNSRNILMTMASKLWQEFL